MTTAQALADHRLIYRICDKADVSPTTVKQVLRGVRPKRVRGPMLRVLAALAAESVDTPERIADAAGSPTPTSLRAV
jgi:hypothetical protein